MQAAASHMEHTGRKLLENQAEQRRFDLLRYQCQTAALNVICQAVSCGIPSALALLLGVLLLRSWDNIGWGFPSFG